MFMKKLLFLTILLPMTLAHAEPSRSPGFSRACRMDVVDDKKATALDRCNAITICYETADDDVYEALQKKYISLSCTTILAKNAQVKNPELAQNPKLNDEARKPKSPTEESQVKENLPASTGKIGKEQ
jgi:hypothetical protein